MHDRQFYQLLNRFELSPAGYRKVRKGVKKRLSRHMRDLGCKKVADYLDKISQDQQTKRQVELLMSVPISRFFRDRKLWEVLKAEILPDIITTCDDTVRVWSAGCACGEEVYSLKIVWSRYDIPLPLFLSLKSLQPT